MERPGQESTDQRPPSPEAYLRARELPRLVTAFGDETATDQYLEALEQPGDPAYKAWTARLLGASVLNNRALHDAALRQPSGERFAYLDWYATAAHEVKRPGRPWSRYAYELSDARQAGGLPANRWRQGLMAEAMAGYLLPALEQVDGSYRSLYVVKPRVWHAMHILGSAAWEDKA